MNIENLSVQYTTESDAWRNSALIPKGFMVHSTATPSVMAKKFRDAFNQPNLGKSVHAFVDDKEIIQCLPWNKKAGHCGKGYKGISGNSYLIGVEMCEPQGLEYNKYWQVESYNPPKDYFKNIWNNMVDLCATLAIEYGWNVLDPNVITSHCEGYQNGIASNHGDPMHWWIFEHKTMDDFRRDVYDTINGNRKDEDTLTQEQFEQMYATMIAKQKGNAPSDWAKEGCEDAVADGIFKGDGNGNYNWQDPMTREAYAVVRFRDKQKG